MSYACVSGWGMSFFHGRTQTYLSRHKSSMKMSSVTIIECRPYLIQQTDHNWTGCAAKAECNRKTDYIQRGGGAWAAENRRMLV